MSDPPVMHNLRTTQLLLPPLSILSICIKTVNGNLNIICSDASLVMYSYSRDCKHFYSQEIGK